MPGYPCCCTPVVAGGIYNYYMSYMTPHIDGDMPCNNAICRASTFKINECIILSKIPHQETINFPFESCHSPNYLTDFVYLQDVWKVRGLSVYDESGIAPVSNWFSLEPQNYVFRSTNKLDQEKVWLIQQDFDDEAVINGYWGPENLFANITGIEPFALTGFPSGDPFATTYDAYQEVYITGIGDDEYKIYYLDTVNPTGSLPFSSDPLRLIGTYDTTVHDDADVNPPMDYIIKLSVDVKPAEARVFDFAFNQIMTQTSSNLDPTSEFSVWFQNDGESPKILRGFSANDPISDYEITPVESGYYNITILTQAFYESGIDPPLFNMRVRTHPNWPYYYGDISGGAYLKELEVKAYRSYLDPSNKNSPNTSPLNHTFSLIDTANENVIISGLVPTGALGQYYSMTNIIAPTKYRLNDSNRFVSFAWENKVFQIGFNSYNYNYSELYIEHNANSGNDPIVYTGAYIYEPVNQTRYPIADEVDGFTYYYTNTILNDSLCVITDIENQNNNGMSMCFDPLTHNPPSFYADLYLAPVTCEVHTLTGNGSPTSYNFPTIFAHRASGIYVGTVQEPIVNNIYGLNKLSYDYNDDHYVVFYPTGSNYILNIDGNTGLYTSPFAVRLTKNGVLLDCTVPGSGMTLLDFDGSIIWEYSGADVIGYSEDKIYVNREHRADNIQYAYGSPLKAQGSGTWDEWYIDYGGSGSRLLHSTRSCELGNDTDIDSKYNDNYSYVYNTSLLSGTPVSGGYDRVEYERVEQQFYQAKPSVWIAGADAGYDLNGTTGRVKIYLNATTTGTKDCYLQHSGASISGGETYTLQTNYFIGDQYDNPIYSSTNYSNTYLMIDILNVTNPSGDPIRAIVADTSFPNTYGTNCDIDIIENYSGLNNYNQPAEIFPKNNQPLEMEFTAGSIGPGLPTIRYTLLSDLSDLSLSGENRGIDSHARYVDLNRVELFKHLDKNDLPLT